MDKSYKYIIGIDEVGRGPIAGPVAVCAFLIKDLAFLENYEERDLPRLRDSKKLSKKQREVWFEYIKVAKTEGFCDYSVSFVSPENIDKFGIIKCIQKALDESLNKIISQKNFLIPGMKDVPIPGMDNFFARFQIFLDGGLKAPKEFVNQQTIIKGDETHPVISCASIMAKVSRDRIMENFAKQYKEYGFENHVGYGTKAHYEAIKKHGKSPIHRKSFIH